MNRRDIALANAPRRGLRRAEAALYVGVGETKFDEWVTAGLMPRPKHPDGPDGVAIWDIKKLDAAFDELPDDGVLARKKWERA